jgi:AraC-like DNA-binding protein
MTPVNPPPLAAADLHLIGDRTEALLARYSRHSFHPHFHHTWAIGIALDHAHHVWCEGHPWTVNPGDAILIPPGTLHTGAGGGPGPWTIGMIFPDPSTLAAPRLRFATVLRGTPLAKHFARALTAALSTTAEPGALLDLATDLVRRAAREQPESSPRVDSRVAHARARIDGWERRDFHVPTLARELDLHPSYLTALFRHTFGIGPLGYWLAGRIELARHRLRAGQCPTEVAHALGFADQSHFTRAFRRAVGIPPGRYRDQLVTRRRGTSPRILEKF